MEEYKTPPAGAEGLPRIDSGVILSDHPAEGPGAAVSGGDKQAIAPETSSDPGTPTSGCRPSVQR